MSTELTNKTVTCRKNHKCDWCGQSIEKGEKAQYRSGVFYGDFYSGHLHLECHSALCRSAELGVDDCYMPYEQKRGLTYDESHA